MAQASPINIVKTFEHGYIPSISWCPLGPLLRFAAICRVARVARPYLEALL